MWSIELDIRLRQVKLVRIIKNTGLDDLQAWEGWSISPQGAAAVGAEVTGDHIPRVPFHGVWLGVAGDFEAILLDCDVGAVGRSADLVAVFAVTESL